LKATCFVSTSPVPTISSFAFSGFFHFTVSESSLAQAETIYSRGEDKISGPFEGHEQHLEFTTLLDQFEVVNADWKEVTANPPRSTIPLLTVTM
jgi:hypothetical protein